MDYTKPTTANSAETSDVREKKVKKVITGKAVKKKQSYFSSEMIKKDLIGIGEYVFKDVLIPTIKKTISEIVSTGTDMLLYHGDVRAPKKPNGSSYISYNSYSSNSSYARPRENSRDDYRYDDIILDNRGEAEEVLSGMVDILDRYHVVSIADLYDLVGLSSRSTDHNYGWTNLSSASTARVKDGYLLKLPKAILLK